MESFIHLHNHTYYSLLDGACRISDLIETAKDFNMSALAITDHGNMFGTIQFYKSAMKVGIRPIIGIETYLAPGSRLEKSGGIQKHGGAYHLILLARNMEGYRNLMKLSSIGFLEGFYYKPRIDREVLRKHAEGLIALSACIKGEVPYNILQNDYEAARKAALFYREIFQDNFYLEIQNHGIPEEAIAREGLKQLSAELAIPLVATNDTHYLKKEHAEAQDILLCLQTNKDRDDPNRMRFSTDQNYFKSPQEMGDAFSDCPESLKTSLEIAEKCHLMLDSDSFHLPRFTIPDGEDVYSLDEYLEKRARKGMSERYSKITPELEKRLEYEISVIKGMGYSGYFLIVADFIQYAREHWIPVGPGRGSAAGSIVAYALGITNVDPIRYVLLFERFLNPERVSMPDIDIDFCYEQREEIIDYVKEKYGNENVTQIITFGSMNARAVIRDVGRVLKIPYNEVDHIAKLIPSQQGITLEQALAKVPELQEFHKKEPYHQLLEYSKVLEGLARHASIHAAGVVIAPSNLTNYVPLFKSAQGDVTTQYDMKSLESIGLLKMDFLGLRTLTVIDHTLKMLRAGGTVIDIDRLDLTDPRTYQIFSEGETIGIFQFESSGMRECLRKLQPTCIEDLIAMNALYRPGPMEMIDDFIQRKKEKSKIDYHHPDLKTILEETYGVIVYQEQVMQIASQLAGFSLGKADVLRRAMGKKSADLMQEQRTAFIEGAAKKKGMNPQEADRIFDLMQKFAGYGFNKSHAVCYSIVAYQTAYLKAHYPKEFMAANLTSEMTDTDRVVILIDECRRMGIEVLPPDVNESMAQFMVTEEGIRYGLGAIKNVGLGAIQALVEGRKREKKFHTIFDFCKNINLRTVNKKVLESLIQSGAMDSLQGTRAQKMAVLPKATSLAQSYQQSVGMGQTSIFGGEDGSIDEYPSLPDVAPWTQTEKLQKEKELLGFYISGHPLMRFEDDVISFTCPDPDQYENIDSGQTVRFCGMISEVRLHYDKNNKPMAFLAVEGFTKTVNMVVFSKVYEKFKNLIKKDEMVAVIGQLDRREGRDEITVQISEMIPLEEARGRYAKRIAMNIKADIPEEDVRKLSVLFKRYPGNCKALFNIQNGPEEMLMKSKSAKIQPNPELIRELRHILGKDNVWIEG